MNESFIIKAAELSSSAFMLIIVLILTSKMYNIFTQTTEKLDKITVADYKVFITLLNPIAPHITEELNEKLGNNTMLAIGTWPTFDEEKTVDTSIQVGVQVNGKLRGTITVSDDDTEDIIKEKALNEDNVKKNIIDKEIVKIIVVPKRIVSIVVR